MKLFLTTVFVLYCSVQIEGGVGIERFDPNQDTSSHCFAQSYGIGAMNEGETKRAANSCVQLECLSNRDISIVGCGSVQAGPPCYVDKGDLSKPHPDCCPKIVCPK